MLGGPTRTFDTLIAYLVMICDSSITAQVWDLLGAGSRILFLLLALGPHLSPFPSLSTAGFFKEIEEPSFERDGTLYQKG